MSGRLAATESLLHGNLLATKAGNNKITDSKNDENDSHNGGGVDDNDDDDNFLFLNSATLKNVQQIP